MTAFVFHKRRGFSTFTLVCLLLIISLLAASANLAFFPQKAFAAKGAYNLKWSAADPTPNNGTYAPTYPKKTPSQLPAPAAGLSGGAGRLAGSSVLADAIAYGPTFLPGNFDAVTSLSPASMALGQVVPFELEIKVDGDITPENGVITVKLDWLAKTTNGGNFGFDPGYGVYAAFVDTSDVGTVDPGNDAKIDSFSHTIQDPGGANERIEGTFQISGLDNGDNIIVEIWVVLKNTILAGITGNVQTSLVSAHTGPASSTGDNISAGNQTVPLLQVGAFFTADADLSIIKTDSPDPIYPGQQLTYTIIVTNNSTDTVANGITVTDTLDPNTTFVSASGYPYTTSGSPVNTVTFTVGALSPGQLATMYINVTVSATVPTNNYPSSNPAPGGYYTPPAVPPPPAPATGWDIVNKVGVTAITDDPDESDNNYFQPTNVLGLAPAIDVEKYVWDGDSFEDADTATGPYLVSPPANVTFQFVITNTGNVALSNVTLTDSPTIGTFYTDQALTTPATFPIPSLAVGGSVTVYGSLPWAAGQQTDTATSAGTPPVGNNVSDNDAANYFGSSPAINIVKKTNGTDNNSAPGVSVAVGSTVTWTYEVTNPGNVPLSSISVTDNNGTSGNTGDDFNPTFTGGDTNANSKLDPGETWTYSATGTAALGQYGNIGTATGTPPVGSNVSDTDPDYYTGITPSIGIQKYANGNDADTAPGITVLAGSTVNFTYAVTNTDFFPLSNVVVKDDNGTSGNTADDVTLVLVSGDTNTNNLLEVGETWNYAASMNAVSGQYTNIATATGIYNGQTYTASDPANYFGASPAINVEKYVWDGSAWDDADSPTGPYLKSPPTTVLFKFVIDNTGNVNLSNVTLTDVPAIANFYTDEDCTIPAVFPIATFTPADTPVAVYAKLSWAAGQQTDTATATGTPPVGSNVSDNDPANYFGAVPLIAIQKYANGQDADIAPGVIVSSGSTVTFTYTVTNPDDVPLSNVVVLDNNGTPGNPGDDFNPTFTGGDTNGNGLLDVGESWTYTASMAAVSGQYTNIAAVSGVYSGQTYTGNDPANYFGANPSIDVEKYVWDWAAWQDADSPTGPYLITNPVFKFDITNTGNVPLSNVTLTDAPTIGTFYTDQGLTIPATFPIASLAPGAANTVTVYGSLAWAAGQQTDTATATGTPPVGDDVSDTDSANYFGSNPAINIVKKTNGTDNNSPPGPTLTLGSIVNWTYEVTNPGNVPLSSINVTDSVAGVTPVYDSGDANNNSLLDPGETWLYKASGTVIAGQYSNIGTATGTPPVGDPVSDTDPDHYFCKFNSTTTTRLVSQCLPNFVLGQSVQDEAIVTGLDTVAPTGTVEFQVSTDGGATWTTYDTQELTPGQGNVSTALSDPYTPTETGTYYFRAIYNGDDLYNGSLSGNLDEPLCVSPDGLPTCTTTLLSSSTISLGQTVTDTATVTGQPGFPAPGGTIIFQVSTDGGVTFNTFSTKTLDSTGKATSGAYLPTSVGTYYFRAIYSGDAIFGTSQSGDKAEPLQVVAYSKLTSVTTTKLSATTISLGQSVTDTATVTGINGLIPTGTVNFQVSTSGVTFNTFSIKTLDSSGKATSAAYKPAATGTYYFRAVYGGDNNYNGSQSGDRDEPLAVVTKVLKSTTTTTTLSTSSIYLGQSITAKAKVSAPLGSFPAPTGTVRFQVSKDGGATWTTYSTITLSTLGTATSAYYKPTTKGTYYFRSIYSGNSNYASSQSGNVTLNVR